MPGDLNQKAGEDMPGVGPELCLSVRVVGIQSGKAGYIGIGKGTLIQRKANLFQATFPTPSSSPSSQAHLLLTPIAFSAVEPS